MSAEITVAPPADIGFGWTVDCSDCELDERMLTEPGAMTIAREHLIVHAPTITVSKRAYA